MVCKRMLWEAMKRQAQKTHMECAFKFFLVGCETYIWRLGKNAWWQRDKTDSLRRQKNELFEFCKKHYNTYNENKMQK